ncbi:ras association domain-containing protein 4 [Anthonomus grandis grandis]|uniref:ras association domain-containing protein 4 n=1 Tax=Anthonomus grandis grandis TaxID=2921223 RepID=UPI002164FD21|nr:ras association domain-containing protein 4 [Anthonomus grandis grandis]
MWKCHKCQKPVYFAERKHSLGYNWHPECLRCEECGKRLNPGQHAEHKGVPYCHVPCYGALFGPQLFGHGSRVESHTSFGKKESPKLGNKPVLPRSALESKIKVYNQFYEGKSGEIRSREVNGRFVLEGSLRIHWGVYGVIHLKENDDQRTLVTVRKRNSCQAGSPDYDTDEDIQNISRDTSSNDISSYSSQSTNTLELSKSDTGIESGSDSIDGLSDSDPNSPKHVIIKSVTLPSKLDVKNVEWDELDDLLQVERKVDENEKLYQTMPIPLPSQISTEICSSETDQNMTITEDSSTLKAPLIDSSLSEDQVPLLTNSLSKDDIWTSNSSSLNRSMSGPDCLERLRTHSPEFDRLSLANSEISTSDVTSSTDQNEEVVLRKKIGSTAIRRRPGKRLSRSKVRRRCSINGHFYDRETSFFTPPHGSQMSVWVTSMVNTPEVIKLLLEKYKVESDSSNFALFVVRDNGEQRRLKDDEYPLLTRVLLGPHEDVAKLFLMDSHSTPEVSSEVAQFLNLSLVECRAILNQYYSQEEKEVARLKEKYLKMKQAITQLMERSSS